MAEGDESKSRLALGDLTNLLGKRGFSTIEKFGFSVGGGKANDTVKRVCVSPHPCTEINSLKGNVVSGISKIASGNWGLDSSKSEVGVEMGVRDGRNDVKGKGIVDVCGGDVGLRNAGRVNVIDLDSCGEIDCSQMDGIAAKNRRDPSLVDFEGGRAVDYVAIEDDGSGKVDVSNEEMINCTKIGGNAIRSGDIETNDELGDGSPTDTSRTVSETGGDCVNDDKNGEVDGAEVTQRSSQSYINDYQSNMDAYNSDNLVLSQSGSKDCQFFSDSQESRVFGVETPTELIKGNDCAYMSEGTASAKDCPCSFCRKAAYIFLDLNYQDIKTRISASKKCQKEAMILAERNAKSKTIGKYGDQIFDRDSNLESQLTYQWRSLFQHMANIWEEESNQLEAKLFPLADLREKCKTDLESINGAPSEKF